MALDSVPAGYEPPPSSFARDRPSAGPNWRLAGGSASQHGCKPRRSHCQRVVLLNPLPTSAPHGTPKGLVRYEALERIEPSRVAIGKNSALSSDDLVVCSDWRGNHRHSARHALNELKGALPPRPGIIGQRHNADIKGLNERNLIPLRPHYFLRYDAWNHWCSAANDTESDLSMTRKARKRRSENSEIVLSGWRTDPADHDTVSAHPGGQLDIVRYQQPME